MSLRPAFGDAGMLIKFNALMLPRGTLTEPSKVCSLGRGGLQLGFLVTLFAAAAVGFFASCQQPEQYQWP